jgi:hypothetical protein
MSWREELFYSLLGALALGGLWAGVVLMMSRGRP